MTYPKISKLITFNSVHNESIHCYEQKVKTNHHETTTSDVYTSDECFSCEICCALVTSNTVALVSCRHCFCLECWRHHLLSRISRGDQEVACPVRREMFFAENLLSYPRHRRIAWQELKLILFVLRALTVKRLLMTSHYSQFFHSTSTISIGVDCKSRKPTRMRCGNGAQSRRVQRWCERRSKMQVRS